MGISQHHAAHVHAVACCAGTQILLKDAKANLRLTQACYALSSTMRHTGHCPYISAACFSFIKPLASLNAANLISVVSFAFCNSAFVCSKAARRAKIFSRSTLVPGCLGVSVLPSAATAPGPVGPVGRGPGKPGGGCACTCGCGAEYPYP